MEIFPNPASHQLTVNFINYKITSSHSIDIVDIQGKVVKHIQNIANENSITISDLSKGQYIINLVDKNKALSSKPIIIE
jgi:hypothetical protein